LSLRLEMLQVARLAPKVLGDSTELVRQFLLRQQAPDGGFRNRAGQSDLYYTVFGLDALIALQAIPPLERVWEYWRSLGGGEGLDLVHLCCLARVWAALRGDGSQASPLAPVEILARVEMFRAHDGGYCPRPASESGTAYGTFLALGAYQDLGTEVREPKRLVRSLQSLQTPDGAWANEANLPVGSTNATAAVVTVLRNLQAPVPPRVSDWLLARGHPQGGFLAAPHAPMPDLLSTATALHALAGLQVSFDPLKEKCLDFIDSLWTSDGSFYGHWGDDALDCEYTFYALLALGHLSL